MDTTVRRTGRVLLLALVLALTAGLAVPTASAEAAPRWAAADQATIRPGVQMVTEGAQCTANFVFTSGEDVLLGYAAHCAGLGGATDTDGCVAGSLPVGTRVTVEGAQHPGTLVYSSWATMQRRGERDPDTCRYNDFALVRLDRRDRARVNPSVPFFGGPTRVGTTTSLGEPVSTYGNSSLRLGLDLLKPKRGLSLGQGGGGWTHTVYTVTPGIPGDSGSGVLSRDGQAVGVLSTLALAPLAGSNGVSDLARSLAYAERHAGVRARLAPGTEPFRAGLLGLLP